MSAAGRLLLLGLFAAALAALAAPGREVERAALAAVDAEEFARLAGRTPATADAIWERLKAMGVSAALLHEETIADLSERGEVVYFTRAEVVRWRAAGLVSSSSGLRGDTLWAKDAKAMARAAEAAAAAGLDVSTATMAGARALELPPGLDPSGLPAGFDPPVVAALSAAGLLPIAASSGPVVSVAGQRLWVRNLPIDASTGKILRAALGRPLRLVAFRVRPGLSLDANLDRLRSSLHVLRGAGPSMTLPAPRPADQEDEARRRARMVLVWLFGAIGPLLAARAALEAARFVRAPTRAAVPLASPVPQAAAGLAAGWAVAALMGLAVAGVAPAGWRDGSARGWMLWTWCAPLLLGGMALFFTAPPSRRGWSAPVRRRDLAALLGFALVAVLLTAPRAAVRASSLWESFDRLSAAGALWWWPWRWREALIGAPALAVALALFEERDIAGEAAGSRPVLLADPRGWLLFGLLAPAGLIAAIGGGGEPASIAIRHGAMAQTFGAGLGAALAALRGLMDSWALRPSAPRTIDLHAKK